MGARPRFVGQINGTSEVSNQRYDEVRAILEEEKPAIVLTHWPVDTEGFVGHMRTRQGLPGA